MNPRRLAGYLLLNAFVSVAATMSVLWFWEATHPGIGVPVTPRATSAAGSILPTLEAALTPLPTFQPTVLVPTPTVYVVKPGDTLSTIAMTYGVTVEEIMAANDLATPNWVSVGQALIIPLAGYLPPTATPGPASTDAPVEPPRPTATADPSQPPPRLVIREVRGAGVLAQETLVLANEGGPADLSGWRLRAGPDGPEYVFPSLTVLQDTNISLHTVGGTNTSSDLYWGQGAPVWAPGVNAELSTANGDLHAQYVVP